MSNKAVTWTVHDVLAKVPELGIPHFQRGLVWGVESRAALLESLFYDTPCGSFVLWVPKDCGSRGVPLDPSICVGMNYLVIDGQQRIRSLHSIFNNRDASDEEDVDVDSIDGQDDAPGNGRKVWCINLTRVPWIAPRLKTPAREFSLFMYTLDPAIRKAEQLPSPLMNNMLPLEVVLSADSWGDEALAPYRDMLKFNDNVDEPAAVELETMYKKLHETVRAMKRRVFFVSIQHRDDPAEMADLYNRINAGGKRVEIEERAFARLVGLHPGTYQELATLFEAVHGSAALEPGNKDTKRQLRDQVLRRQKERAFGFKLFVRVFLQVCQHHMGFRQGKSEFSFELVNKAPFLTAYRQLGTEQTSYLWRETRQVLAQVRSVLREELACDDLRALPDTMSLTPVFQLLIHYPALREEKYRALVASLCMRLLIAELDQRTLLKLLQEAANPGRVAFDVIPDMLQVLEKATEKAKFASRLEQAQSIQHRYVLLLYWLQRHLGARDFLYARLPKADRLNPPEAVLEEEAEPEKQHLLPFIKAQKLYGGELRRSGSHLVNSIGNLTYISREENGFERGLGDAFADLEAEPEENLRAHLMLGGSAGHRVLADYAQLRSRFAAPGVSPGSKDKHHFERMVRQRREVIQAGFQTWLAEIDTSVCESLGVSSVAELRSLARTDTRVEPVAPEFAQLRDVAYVIRELGLSHEDEDRVVYLAKHAARISTRKDDKPQRDLWFTKKRKCLWVTIGPGHVSLRFASDVLQEHRQEILEALGLEDEDVTIPDMISLKPVPEFQPLLEVMKVLAPEIEAKSDTSAGRWEKRSTFWRDFSEFLSQRPGAVFQIEKPRKTGGAPFFSIGESGMLKGKISAATGKVEIYLRLKGAGGVQDYGALLARRQEIEEAFGQSLYWREKEKAERYQIGLELGDTSEDDRAAQFEWLHDMAKQFKAVFGPRLKSIA